MTIYRIGYIKCVCLLLLATLPLLAIGQDVDRLEYFFDTDPGFGNGISVTITEGGTVDATFAPDISGLSPGFHLLYLRAKDTSGDWSYTSSTPVFLEPGVDAGVDVSNNVQTLEYFFDTDPGNGTGDPIIVTTPANQVTLSEEIDLSALADGFHTLNLRAQSNSGTWGPVITHPFFQQTSAAANGDPNLAAIEYFFDDDPGFSLATGVALPVTPASSIDKTFSPDISTLDKGFHNFYLRTQNADADWSPTVSHSFFIEPGLATSATHTINVIEYFFDDDPGPGIGQPFTVFTAAEGVDATQNLDFSGVDLGFHILNLRAKNAENFWGPAAQVPVFVQPNVQTAPLPDIVAIQYELFEDGTFIGQGSVTGFSPASVVDLTFTADTSGLSDGAEFQILVSALDTNSAISLAIASSGLIEASYADWLNVFFNAEEQMDSAISGFTADPDNDGVPNGIEFALRSHPRQESSNLLPVTQRTGDFLEIVYRQRRGGAGIVGVDYMADGVQYTVEVSDDLSPAGWSSGNGLVQLVGTPINNGDGTETVTVQLAASVISQVQKFLRLKVTLL